MSSYPYWSLHFPLRADVEPGVLRVLTAGAQRSPALAEDLTALHPVPRYYLADVDRLVSGEPAPLIGSPVRLSGLGGRYAALSIDLCWHDDEYANGAWIFWVWVLLLANRPVARAGYPLRQPIGYSGYEWNERADVVLITEAGITDRGVTMSYADLEQIWSDVVADPAWDEYGW